MVCPTQSNKIHILLKNKESMHTARASSESMIQFMSSMQAYCMIYEAEGKHPARQMSESEKESFNCANID